MTELFLIVVSRFGFSVLVAERIPLKHVSMCRRVYLCACVCVGSELIRREQKDAGGSLSKKLELNLKERGLWQVTWG